MQYFVVMIDYGRRGREAVVDPEITRREVVARVACGEYSNICFIHEIADRAVEDVTATILAEDALPEIPATEADLQIMPATCASTRSCDGAFAKAARCAPDLTSNRKTPHTTRTVDPVVLRAARSACARAASFNG